MAEPPQLAAGKRFHAKIQKEWIETAKDGTPHKEYCLVRLNGRRGFVDVLVREDEDDDTVSIVEVKGTNWDAIKPENVRRNVRRQIRQIWSYVEVFAEREKKSVYPGVIFPDLPKEEACWRLIEKMFNDEGIQVVWHSETIEETTARLGDEGDSR